MKAGGRNKRFIPLRGGNKESAMKKFAATALVASMFMLAACSDNTDDPTPTVIDEPDASSQVKSKDPCDIKGPHKSTVHCP